MSYSYKTSFLFFIPIVDNLIIGQLEGSFIVESLSIIRLLHLQIKKNFITLHQKKAKKK